MIFSATTCPYCKALYPSLKTFAQQHTDWQIIMVSKGLPSENQELLNTQGFNFPVLEADETIGDHYQVPGTPFIYLIDEKGFIIRSGYANTLKDLEDLIAMKGT